MSDPAVFTESETPSPAPTPPNTPLEKSRTGLSYSYDQAEGWRRWRALRPGRGMWHDVKRRAPYYWSDITDAWTYRTLASVVRMYFVNLLPAIAYTLEMYRRTGEFYGINEGLFSSALAAMVFSILGTQPLTIVGVTGLISLFNFTIYDIIEQYDVTIYPQFMAWVGIWTAIFHWLIAVFNACDYMRYVTDFSSESFGFQGCRGAGQRVRGRRATIGISCSYGCDFVLWQCVRIGKAGRKHNMEAGNSGHIRRLCLCVPNAVLGGLHALPRHLEGLTHHDRTHRQGILSNTAPELVD